MTVLLQDFLSGNLGSTLAAGASGSVADSSFAGLPAVTSPDTLKLVLDPDGTAGDPEIITITDHTAASTTATISRASEGTTAREHLSSTKWVNAVTTTDFNRLGFDGTIAADLTGNVTGDVTGDVTGALTGNADTATALETARTIGGVSFNGTANINLPGVNTAGTQDTSGNAATATSAAACTGNAATATALATARAINGVDFDGTAAITVTAAAGTLTGTTLKSTVTASSLTSVGTLGSLTVSGGVEVQGLLDVSNQAKIEFGNSNDQIRYSDTDNRFEFWMDGNKHATLGNPSIWMHQSGGTLLADSPPSGTGNAAEWAVYLGTNVLYQNTSVAADKENISADLGTHLTADMIDSVVPKMWNRITAPGIPEIGPIADEIDEVSPFLASHGTDANDEQVLTGINKTAWMSLMTLALQDIRTRLAALEG